MSISASEALSEDVNAELSSSDTRDHPFGKLADSKLHRRLRAKM
jgi:hypothetical protein